MKILGERDSFQADHSSASYLFYSPTRLSPATRTLARKFSSRTRVGAHTSSYMWHGEYDGFSGGQDVFLLQDLFEILIKESYDWWTFTVCVPFSQERMKLLRPFHKTYSDNDCGIYVERIPKADKIRIDIHCALDPDGDWVNDMSGADDDEFYAEEHGNQGDWPSFSVFVPHLLAFRKELIAGRLTGMQAIAARFDSKRWKAPKAVSKSARWIAECIDTTI